MSKHTISGHIYWQHSKWMKEPRVRFDEYDMRRWSESDRDGRVHVAEHSIEVEVPDNFDPRPEMVANLQAEKERIRAEFAAKVAEIDSRISKLQAIEYVEA